MAAFDTLKTLFTQTDHTDQSIVDLFKKHNQRTGQIATVADETATSIEKMADRISDGEFRVSQYDGGTVTGYDSIKRTFQDMVKKDVKEMEKYGKKALREFEKTKTAVGKAIQAVGRDTKSIHEELGRQFKQHKDNIKKALEAEVAGVPEEYRGFMPDHRVTVDGVTYKVEGSIEEALSTAIGQAAENLDKAKSTLDNYAEHHIGLHNDTLTKIEELTGDIEKATKKTAEQLLGKAESGLTKATDEAFSKFEKVGDEAASKGKFMAGAGIGAVAGAIAGNMMSSEETKTQNTFGGGLIGAIIGGAVQYWSSAKSALGAVAHGPAAKQIMDVASHSRF